MFTRIVSSSATAFYLLVHCFLCSPAVRGESNKIEEMRVPDGGIQPQAIIDSEGVLHLIYYKGDPAGGNIFYVRRKAGENFSAPLAVNSQKGSAIAIGTIRGAQLALGKNNRPHVVWNGGSGAAPAKHEGMPLLYSRLNDAGTAFEPERDIITYASGLDGGCSVAADPAGNVYVMWHGHRPDGPKNETGRAVFISRSSDSGATFEPETQASPSSSGACGCCGMRAFADANGEIYAVYRQAAEGVNRDEVVLASKDKGKTFQVVLSHPWTTPACPMSSAFLSQRAGPGQVLAAWETEGQVYFSTLDPKSLTASRPQSPDGTAKRKHPVAVTDSRGEMLLVWTEGTGWNKGGAVVWQLYDKSGKAEAKKVKAGAISVWSFAAAVPKPEGGFIVIY